LDDEESNSEWHNEWAKPSEYSLKRTRRSTKGSDDNIHKVKTAHAHGPWAILKINK